MSPTAIQIKKFPADLWRRIRVRAAERNQVFRDFVNEAVKKHLKSTETCG